VYKSVRRPFRLFFTVPRARASRKRLQRYIRNTHRFGVRFGFGLDAVPGKRQVARR
jgi:hypothetical protein